MKQTFVWMISEMIGTFEYPIWGRKGEAISIDNKEYYITSVKYDTEGNGVINLEVLNM